MNAREYLHKVARERVFLLDGGMGTQLQSANLTAEDFGGPELEGANDWLSVTQPELIRGIHQRYFEAGADAAETNSFGGSRVKMAEWGLEEHTEKQNMAAASLARSAATEAEKADGRRRLVFGSIGPSGFLPGANDPALSNIEPATLRALFKEQATFLQKGGADVFLVETGQDILEVKLAVLGILDALNALGVRDQHAVLAQVTLDISARMLLGTNIEAAMATLTGLDLDGIGLNCSTGPEHMKEPVRFLVEHTPADFLISIVPNAGLPINQDGCAVYPETPAEMSKALVEFAKMGVNIVGGCCGTTPDHIKAFAEALDGIVPAPRTTERSFWVSGSLEANALLTENRPFLIGERLNAQGSRKVKELLLENNYEELVEVARGQLDTGAHMLDLCCAMNEREDEKEQVLRLMHDVCMTVPLPIVIDSTEEDVVAAALEAMPGRGMLNSLHLESGRGKMDRLLPLLAEVGAGFVAMTIDQESMAKTADRKLAVAREIYDIAVTEYGFLPEQLYYDPLTFTLATGEEEYRSSAVETIEGIRRIKEELPGVRTVLGVSNVSFGLDARIRPILNSVFLYHCVQAGLDAAIVHPIHVLPYPEIPENLRMLAEDLVLNRRPDALELLIDASQGFEGRSAKQTSRSYEGLSLAEEIHQRILFRDPDGIIEALEGLRKDRPAVEIINDVLLPAMKDVGDRFGAGQLILPFVLKSAETMKKAVAHIEQFLDKNDTVAKGVVVLATVYGDVHDIGKNLVATILSNNGYTVHDLGKQTPADTILQKADELKADAIGLSAMLVSTSKQMPLIVSRLTENGDTRPVLIGGAAINRGFGYRINHHSDDLHQGGTFYCKDAFEGLEVLNRIHNEGHPAVLSDLHNKMTKFEARQKDKETTEVPANLPRSSIVPMAESPPVPFEGVGTVESVDPSELFPLMEDSGLFKVQWGVRAKNKEDFERLMDKEFRPLKKRFEEQTIADGLLDAKAAYGYFPVQVEKDQLRFEVDGEELIMPFPRQTTAPNLSLCDYFKDGDRVPLFVSSVGRRFETLVDTLQKNDNYSESFLLHGFAMELAESLAEWTHRRIRSELGVSEGQGKRYSPGYPACPDLELQRSFFKLLKPEQIGMGLTESCQLLPEASVSALVVVHPESTYFNVK